MAQSIFEKKSEGRVEYVESLSETESIEKRDAIISTVPADEEGVVTTPPSSPEDIVKQVLSLDDDPTLNPWTFRMWFIGTCLSVFAA
jgi:hypothetical protein